MDPLFQIPEDFSALTDEELRSFVDTARETASTVAATPSEFISESRSGQQLLDEMSAGVAAIEAANAVLAQRETEEPAPEGEPEPETPAEPTEPSGDAAVDADALAALAARAAAEPETPAEPTPAEEPAAPAGELAHLTVDHAAQAEALATALGPVVQSAVTEGAKAAVAAVTAAAEKDAPTRLPRPARARSAAPPDAPEHRLSMVAAGENLGIGLGAEFPSDIAIADAMIKRRHEIGDVPEGTHGDKVPIARTSWKGEYSSDRSLVAAAPDLNMEKIAAVIDPDAIRAAMEERKAEGGSLVASGGLCAPVTPYYQLQAFSIAERPVRAALPSFNADRGGIRFARPASLATVVGGNAVGIRTEAQDRAGGTNAAKTCQVIACPAFSEVDVSAIYHCLQFGNLGARAFPELVAQWNSLTLAAHARVAETALLDGIRAASTQVTASNAMALGVSAQLLNQIITAGACMRSRHRMDPDAVLRVLLPDWVLEMFVSDTYRGQFNRFDTNGDDFVRLLRENDIEPSFYIDGATGRGQVAGTQAAGVLNEFPGTVEWYLYPEGSFLYLDGGVLELGLVRDSVLNASNDFQMFGEVWENIAFIGVESLAVTTTIDDRGAVAAAVAAGQTNYA